MVSLRAALVDADESGAIWVSLRATLVGVAESSVSCCP